MYMSAHQPQLNKQAPEGLFIVEISVSRSTFHLTASIRGHADQGLLVQLRDIVHRAIASLGIEEA